MMVSNAEYSKCTNSIHRDIWHFARHGNVLEIESAFEEDSTWYEDRTNAVEML